ncbi:hypothetical protein PsYK624_042940 [Phanerochaete sordida]|uniref:BTB domain-containing protein n=1 Tax=Phanerochaete sordida TaxID=48140 RepID=A0A9P3LAB3_9APHY|nr:hypothetical protein PsYK624_042940 [Phanerochaete sordida]
MPLSPQTGPSRPKRQRTDDSDLGVASTRSVVRDEKIWYDDGNIVVCAVSIGNGEGLLYGCRCHASVLAELSPVLKARLALPSAEDDMLDGARCIDLDDAWEDVRDTLRLLYGRISIAFERRHHETIGLIAGSLRLAAKYEMDEILLQLAPLLERDWPIEYAEWERSEAELKRRDEEQKNAAERDGLPFVQNVQQDPAAVLQVAQQARIRSVLPAVFYELCRRDIGGGTKERPLNTALLSRDDFQRITIGRERLAAATQKHLVERILHHLSRSHVPLLDGEQCTKAGAGDSERNRSACIQPLHEWWGELYVRNAPYISHKDPLGAVDRVCQFLLVREGAGGHVVHVRVCEVCRGALARLMRSQAQKLWDELPKVFDLNTLLI